MYCLILGNNSQRPTGMRMIMPIKREITTAFETETKKN
jgi:hypothetical protein